MSSIGRYSYFHNLIPSKMDARQPATHISEAVTAGVRAGNCTGPRTDAHTGSCPGFQQGSKIQHSRAVELLQHARHQTSRKSSVREVAKTR